MHSRRRSGTTPNVVGVGGLKSTVQVSECLFDLGGKSTDLSDPAVWRCWASVGCVVGSQADRRVLVEDMLGFEDDRWGRAKTSRVGYATRTAEDAKLITQRQPASGIELVG
uniref:Uncharacterized protein n=1 Tax=Mycena chlorophos TaxID=658473 RepID=A0ABQ0LCQ9_MYCCL|nr:predicted protein [Mycena chlorophos]